MEIGNTRHLRERDQQPGVNTAIIEDGKEELDVQEPSVHQEVFIEDSPNLMTPLSEGPPLATTSPPRKQPTRRLGLIAIMGTLE